MSNLDRTDPTRLNVTYTGEGKPLFILAMKTTFLTIITLGIYRFWAKTRIRRYYWSALRPGGDPFEYSGTGLEKFLGFLIAVAFLAVYLGLFNTALIFTGLVVWPFGDGDFNELSYNIMVGLSSLAVLPFIYYAQYRGRRYMLSRTRWRGIRFGVDKAAWGYVARAIGHTVLTILTLGLLLPRQTYFLEKYMYDRTYFGDAKFDMIGEWRDLFPAMKHLGIAVVIGLAAALCFFGEVFALGGILIFVAYIWFLLGFVYFGIKSFEIMAGQKRLNGEVLFVSEPRTGKFIGVYLLGSFLASTIATAILAVVAAVLAVFARIFGLIGRIDLMNLDGLDAMDPFLAGAIGVGAVVGYIIFFALFVALSQVFITQPILEHYASETQVINPAALDTIQQREQDDFAEAEGFADALDVGAAI